MPWSQCKQTLLRCDGHLILNTIDSVIPHLYETDRRTRAMENPPEAEMEKLELDAQRKAAKEAKKGVRYGNWVRGEELELLSLVSFVDIWV